MTERHPPPRHSRLEDVAEWHLIPSSPENAGAGCAVSASMVETYGLTSSGEAEGC